MSAGCKPNPHRALHPQFIRAIRALGPIGPLATIAGYPHASQLYRALRRPIPVHAINVDRLITLAARINYVGDLFAEVKR